ncbi:MAG TPA: hypothetical protein VFJ71_00345 [Candidatus Limnocylindrales bacterium]|nr:hypothetical protein [Candidatus Limnocylindrales bacterium]
MEAFVGSFAIVFGTAFVLLAAWAIIRALLVRSGRWGAERVVDAVRRHDPVAGVADGANAWSCGRCKSVNRPDATVCYSCRGARSEVEHLQGRI